MNANGGKIYEIVFHGRGGQGLITGMEILADVAFEDGFKDVLTIPIIGAERRGAPIRAFLRLSPDRQIKSHSAITNPDITVIFDQTLLELPGVGDSIKRGIVLLNVTDNFEYKLFQNYPNPFNPSTNISFTLARSGFVKILLYDTYGKVVDIILDKYFNAGNYSITYTPINLSSGIYYYKLITTNFTQTKKMLFLK